MKLIRFSKFLFLVILPSPFSICWAEEYAGNNSILYENNTCPRIGALSGQIIIPEDENYFARYSNNIVIRLGGVQYSGKDSNVFEFYPDNNGCFSIPQNFLPVGSSLSLYIWDQSGVLNKKILPIYISEKANFYNIILKSQSYTSSLAQLFVEDKKQYFENTGLCGYVVGVSPDNLEGAQVFLQNNSGKYFSAKYFNSEDLPLKNLNEMSQSGHFCFFNVNNCSDKEEKCQLESHNFKLQINLRSGETYSFDTLLPAYSFSDDLFFDLKTSVFRPVEINKLTDSENISYSRVTNIKITTSPNFESINLAEKSKNELVYFPLGNDLLTIDYELPYELSSRFFILKTNAELYTKKLLNIQAEYQAGQTYVDKLSPVNLRIFDPAFMKENQEYLDPLLTQDMGSVFLGLDLKNINRSENISVFLRDFTGKDISEFFSVRNKFNYDVIGFFYNIPIGFYQLFVVDNSSQYIIYTSLVQSIQNKTQVIIDDIYIPKKVIEVEKIYDPNLVYIINSNWPENLNFVSTYSNEINDYDKNNILISFQVPKAYESYLEGSKEGFNNVFLRVGIEALCSVPQKQENKIELPPSAISFLYVRQIQEI